MIRALALAVIFLVAIALPTPGRAHVPPPEICEIVWPPLLKLFGGRPPPERVPPEGERDDCPTSDGQVPREHTIPPEPSPCVTDPATGMCSIDP